MYVHVFGSVHILDEMFPTVHSSREWNKVEVERSEGVLYTYLVRKSYRFRSLYCLHFIRQISLQVGATCCDDYLFIFDQSLPNQHALVYQGL